MKHLYSKILLLAFSALGLNAGAQCTGCTNTIAGSDAANHVIGAGQVYCVAAGGSMSGLITITSGGTLCNSGTITSSHILVAGGIFKNYGTLNNQNVMVSSAGSFTNFATANIDSLYIAENSSRFYNQGTVTNLATAIAQYANAVNSGTFTTNLWYDSLGTVTNNGVINIADMFGNTYSSNYTNNGKLTVTNDFGNGYSSTFLNNGYMKINRDFYNGNNAGFTTNCMMQVGRDWYNSATVYGPSTACGGFSITGLSLNSGTIGTVSKAVDICDAGNPPSGIDGNSGIVHVSTTYCSCTNNCLTFGVGIKELSKESSVSISTIYPNPANEKIMINMKALTDETVSIDVKDMMGRVVIASKLFNAQTGENVFEINTSSLSEGTYIVSLTNKQNIATKKMFTIVK